MSNTYQPERIRDFHDEKEGLTIWCADDGNGTAWLEVETSDDTGVTGTLKLTPAQAAVLDSELLNQAIPRLRGHWFWQTMGRITTAHGLAGQVAAIKAAREPVTPQPTMEEQRAARRAWEDRTRTAEQAVKKAQDVVDWYTRSEKIVAQLSIDLAQATQLDAGLDLSSIEGELAEHTRIANLLPGARVALDEAKAELAAARAWNGWDND